MYTIPIVQPIPYPVPIVFGYPGLGYGGYGYGGYGYEGYGGINDKNSRKIYKKNFLMLKFTYSRSRTWWRDLLMKFI